MNASDLARLMSEMIAEGRADMAATGKSWGGAKREGVNGHLIAVETARDMRNSSSAVKARWYVDRKPVAVAKVAGIILS